MKQVLLLLLLLLFTLIIVLFYRYFSSSFSSSLFLFVVLIFFLYAYRFDDQKSSKNDETQNVLYSCSINVCVYLCLLWILIGIPMKEIREVLVHWIVWQKILEPYLISTDTFGEYSLLTDAKWNEFVSLFFFKPLQKKTNFLRQCVHTIKFFVEQSRKPLMWNNKKVPKFFFQISWESSSFGMHEKYKSQNNIIYVILLLFNT